ncbi:HEPN domain-containing protein [bacterium]|nr:HEPN domain-containing protein [bacterium]
MTKTPELQKLLNDWLAFAKENLLYAKGGLKTDFSPYNTICFLCQGSAEKYLKAYLISRGWELEKIHDLRELLEYAVEYDDSFSEIFPETGILNRYITEGRYPGDVPFESINENDAREAVAAAEKIAEFVLVKMSST